MGSRLEEAGYLLVYEDLVTARMPDADERAHLGLGVGQSVVVAWRRAFDQPTGRVLEVTLRLINPGLHELVYRY